MPIALFGFGPQELIIILVIVLVIFGASRVPKLMRGMGEGIQEFKKAVKDKDEDAVPEETAPVIKENAKDSEKSD